MKKILCFLLFILFSGVTHAQLDREHWFAPMMDRTGNADQYQTLYISTNQATPFPVSVYSNNVLLTTLNVSKGNPQKYAIPRDRIITTVQSDLFTPINKGIYVKADYAFYANLRFSVTNHAEIVTGKGIAATGTEFRAAMAPLTVSSSIQNFMCSVLATQDNTTVTVNGYSSGVVFSNGSTASSLTFTLNKGQSYIIDGRGTVAGNWSGFIGAKITSNKPISMTNGNFNGQYAGNYPNSSDILMDQSVPIDKLGNEFALVKGNGGTAYNMEHALVVATVNNTAIYCNDETTPIATMNAGQYFVVPSTKYINQGNNHYNLHIKTTQNAYVYQLLAGSQGDIGGSSNLYGEATGGFNFIPALNCYLPKNIDEIGLIDENFVVTPNAYPNGILNIPTKLNMVTETGATVLVNGVAPSAANGPYPLSGAPNWVSYSIPNVSGNITVTSTKAITAGISAGSDAVGYGGYFAGFPTTPAIIKLSGTCIPGVVLTVDPQIYETYQWALNGTPIPGATGTTYTPTESGNYTVSVTTGSCAPLVSANFLVLKCPIVTTESYSTCGPLQITPTFTSASTQTVNPATVAISTAPTLGTATVNTTTGIITYTPNPGANGTDTFTYTFSGNSQFPDTQTVTVTLHVGSLSIQNATLTVCKINGQGTFNLNSAVVTTQTPVNIKYYPTLADANSGTNEITNPSAYVSSGGTAYAVVTTPECRRIAEIALNFFPFAEVTPITVTNCDDNFDGIIDVNFTAITAQVLPNAGYFTVHYYLNQADAIAGNANYLPANWTYSANTTVYIRVESPDGCPPVIKALQFNIGEKIPLTKTTFSATLCDDNTDGIMQVDLGNYQPNFTADPAVAATYYNTLADAQNQTGAIANPVTVTGTQTYYIRFQKTGMCPNIASITISVKTLAVQDASLTTCKIGTTGTFNLTNAVVTTQTPVNIKYYPTLADAQNGTAEITNPTAYVSAGGTVFAVVTTADCKKFSQISLNFFPVATVADFTGIFCDDNFDGQYDVNFTTITNQIVNNPTYFNVRWYANITDANAGNANTLPNVWSFPATTTVYIRVDSPDGCAPVIKPITLNTGTKVPLITGNVADAVCDDDFDGIKQINLANYLNQFTADPAVSASYFLTLANAQNNTNPLSSLNTVNNAQTFFIRFQKPGMCPEIGKISITIKIPKKSETLEDQIICKNMTVKLDAGPGFDSYHWSTGATTQTITVGAGNYWVDLTFNGCVYRQTVTVTEVPNVEITAIDISGNTVTINVSGGSPPYEYSLDGINWQSSNTFTNVPRGSHIAYVRSADACATASKDFVIINLINVITPNGDGVNDVINYSDLMQKTEPVFKIFDRYGAQVFEGTPANRYTWDGTIGGRPVPTATYWYTIQWKEYGAKTPVQYSSWLLVKHRNDNYFDK